MNRLLLAVLCLSLAACGGSSGPSGPSPVPTPSGVSTLTFTSTVTGAPVSGARVTVAGVSYTTNSAGQVTLASPASAGATVDASVSGFVDRATVVGSTGAMTLWQVPAGVDSTFVRQLVYNHGTSSEVLWRPTATTVYVQLTGALASDSSTRAVFIQASAMNTAMTGGRIQVQVNDAPPQGSVVLVMQINSSITSAALTFVSESAGRITGARVEFQSLSAAQITRAVAHEIGHGLGFGHPSSGIMCSNTCGVPDFGQSEKDTYTSMLARNPGTLAPDNDRSTSAASFGSATHTFACDVR